jgi:hypothetical protein
LEQIKDVFDARLEEVMLKIPSIFAFEEGEFNNNIGDGGNDMFDGGNFLGTDIEIDFEYSNNEVRESDVFGAGSRYFTKKYPGAMFVLVADNTGADAFSVPPSRN